MSPKKRTNNHKSYDELNGNAKAVLFGHKDFLHNHAGTMAFAHRVGIYARQHTGYTAAVGRTIYEEMIDNKVHFWKPVKNGARSLDKNKSSSPTPTLFQPATKSDTIEKIELLFEQGGGKVAARKRSTGKGDNEPPFHKGQSVYGFEDLYAATVLEVERDLEGGYDVTIHYKGFTKKHDATVSAMQVLPVNAETKRLFERLDKTQLDGDRDRKKPRRAPPEKSTTTTTAAAMDKEPDDDDAEVPDAVASDAAVTTANWSTTTSLSLQQTIQRAKSQCDRAMQESQNSLEDFKRSVMADWVRCKLEKPLDAPSDVLPEQLPPMYGQVEASLAPIKAAKWKQAEKHLVAFIECLMEDNL